MKVLVILGPTASGKTRLAVQLARQLDGEILSADSRQVYRGLDIGTGKDRHEYGEIPCHLIDLVDPGEPFDLFQYQQRCHIALSEILARHRLPILTGGSGMYLAAIVQDYRLVPAQPDPLSHRELEPLSDQELTERLLTLQPIQHNTTNLDTRARIIRALEIAQATHAAAGQSITRPTCDFLILGMRWERPVLRARIAHRLQERLENGLIDEVSGLLARGIAPATLEAFGLEYRFVTRFVLGQIDQATLFDQLVQAIRQFAKRQETWFRRMERQGVTIHWLDAAHDPEQTALTLIRTAWSFPVRHPSSQP
ncbi:MAG: tRNA (adenosine(37)-N6)-dimethylallyltransferase MiaA [Magnetococcales bacterium]|nr:tRNA (adenosine(37)-N6)-dimethylallyltransferase MiaA [Magnetococcales bacterium]NGZ06774.1 tRNA (adenosine(37)-N6)-dimethylallyltransferase MiaA [Magnetococcales bacterium]